MKRLALTIDGRLTYCSASEENIGKGRCNHIDHQKSNETKQEFLNRIAFDGNSKIINIPKNKKDFLDEANKLNTLGGAQDKFIDSNFIYKCDNIGTLLGDQRNALSEEMTCLIEQNIENFEFVRYETFNIKWKDSESIASKSYNFKRDGDSFKDLRSLLGEDICDSLIHEEYDEYGESLNINHQDELDKLESIVKERTNLSIKEYCLKLISLDLITLNGDRALNNIGVIYNKHENEFRFAPCFDNGDGLLSYNEFDYLETEDDFLECENDEDLQICTFGVSKNSDYLKLISDNGGPFLKINLKKLTNDINNYKNNLYDDKIVERNKRFLLTRLNKYKGILFEDIS